MFHRSQHIANVVGELSLRRFPLRRLDDQRDRRAVALQLFREAVDDIGERFIELN